MMTENAGVTSRSMTSPPQGAGPAIRRRRVLVCTPFPPRLDARHGGRATAQLLLRLAERNELALLCLCPRGAHVDAAIGERCADVVEVAIAEHRLPRRVVWAL